MMTEQRDDEAIAALNAFHKARDDRDIFTAIFAMRAALDAAAAWHRAQSPSPLREDAGKIVVALRDLLDCLQSGGYEEEGQARDNARAVLPLAESLLGKIEAVERERDEAQVNARRCSDDYMAIRKTLAATEHQVGALQSKLAASESEKVRLREALEPFAARCDAVETFIKDRARDGGSHLMPLDGLGLSDFRRARAALTGAPPTSEDSPGLL
jgi:hypothetical protein